MAFSYKIFLLIFVILQCQADTSLISFPTNEIDKTTTEEHETKIPAVCLLPKDIGPCRAGFPAYYFNSVTGECEKFVYGGCDGNNNKFLSKKICEDTCVNF